jgi:hypothetical protein
MAKTAILVGIISMIMMQSVSGAPRVSYNQDRVEDATGQQTLKAYLRVGGYASNLADKDWGLAGQSDPYMEVIAEDVDGHIERQETSVKGGTNNPKWYNELKFSERIWSKITVKIWDDDGHRSPDQLCPTQEISVITGSYAIFNCNPGQATVTYSHQVTPPWPR